MREHPFELRLCATLEARREVVVARQIGGGVHQPGNRILDVVLVGRGPAFDARAAVTDQAIPPAAIHSPIGPGRARPWPPDEGRGWGNGDSDGAAFHPETASRVLEAALEVGFFERERVGGTDQVRQTVRYPAWFDQLTGIENKPDLGDPGALAAQLRHDVRLGLLDRVVVATETHVTGAHLNRLPDPVGVWQFRPTADDESLQVVRPATRLSSDGWGTEIVMEGADQSEIRLAGPAAKARARIRVAERAYGKGWRPDGVPACEHAKLTAIAGTPVPDCGWFDEAVDPRECGPSCPAYAAADPPEVDAAAERDRRTPWVAAPPGRATRQAGIGDFQTEADEDPPP